MCLDDRIKSATPSFKGHKEVYLKRERGFFREFVSLGQLYLRKMFSCFTTPSGTHTPIQETAVFTILSSSRWLWMNSDRRRDLRI